jgi:hypothetical protein
VRCSVDIGKCHVDRIRVCPRGRYRRWPRLRHGGVTGQGLVRLFLALLDKGQGGMNNERTDPLGDPGTWLTTAVSNNVPRREPLQTVPAGARAASHTGVDGCGYSKKKQKKKKGKHLDDRGRVNLYPPLLQFIPCYHMW